jgi:hypothetical protein
MVASLTSLRRASVMLWVPCQCCARKRSAQV